MIISNLASKGILLKRPSQVNVLLNGYDYIVNVVNTYEQNGDLVALQEDPTRISSKTALERINYLKQNSLPYLDEKGKYQKIIFHKAEFNRLYGLNNAVEQPAVEQPQVYEQPVFQPEPMAPVVEQPVIQEPTLNVSAFAEDTGEQLFVASEPAPLTVEQPVINETVAPEVSSPINMSSFEESVPVTEQPVVNTQTEADPLDDILSKPQTIALNDETFERYDILSDITARIIFEIYHQDELSDNIADNLIKLITNDAADDKTIVFKAITYGKTISQEEKDYICRALDEEFGKDEDKEYTGIMNLKLGR